MCKVMASSSNFGGRWSGDPLDTPNSQPPSQGPSRLLDVLSFKPEAATPRLSRYSSYFSLGEDIFNHIFSLIQAGAQGRRVGTVMKWYLYISAGLKAGEGRGTQSSDSPRNKGLLF